MDVELQILKHLKRSPTPTVSIIDRYCDSRLIIQPTFLLWLVFTLVGDIS